MDVQLKDTTKLKLNHTATMTILVVAVCLVIGYMSWLSFQRVGEIYLAETEKTIIQINEELLQNTLHNVVQEIDRTRAELAKNLKQTIDDRLALVQYGSNFGTFEFAEYFAELFSDSTHSWTALLWNHVTGEVFVNAGTQHLDDLSDLYYYQMVTRGELTALWGISSVLLDEMTKSLFKARLSNLSFSDGVTLKITEGSYVAAESRDLLSSTLFYEDFNWTITMAIPLAELDKYLVQTDLESAELAILLSLRLVLILVFLVILGLGVVLLVEHFHYRRTTAKLEMAVSEDLLTGALTRRAGTEELREAFTAFQTGCLSPAILIFDVDNLKQINDSCGHQGGDMVLNGIVAAVNRHLRSSDQIIRWGGDEFVVILQKPKDSATKQSAKIVESVSLLEFEFDGQLIKPTISLGVARFLAEDKDFMDAINRADQALYQAKKGGKNQLKER